MEKGLREEEKRRRGVTSVLYLIKHGLQIHASGDSGLQ
jgi:hypothetical protein